MKRPYKVFCGSKVNRIKSNKLPPVMSLGAMSVRKALSIQTSLCYCTTVFLKQAIVLLMGNYIFLMCSIKDLL